MSYYSTFGYAMAPECRNALGKKPDNTKKYGTLGERKEKISLFCVGAIIADSFLNFSYVVSVCCGWVMIARDFAFGVFRPLPDHQKTPI